MKSQSVLTKRLLTSRGCSIQKVHQQPISKTKDKHCLFKLTLFVAGLAGFFKPCGAPLTVDHPKAKAISHPLTKKTLPHEHLALF